MNRSSCSCHRCSIKKRCISNVSNASVFLKYLFGTTTSIRERTYVVVTAEASLVHPDGPILAAEPVVESDFGPDR